MCAFIIRSFEKVLKAHDEFLTFSHLEQQLRSFIVSSQLSSRNISQSNIKQMGLISRLAWLRFMSLLSARYFLLVFFLILCQWPFFLSRRQIAVYVRSSAGTPRANHGQSMGTRGHCFISGRNIIYNADNRSRHGAARWWQVLCIWKMIKIVISFV